MTVVEAPSPWADVSEPDFRDALRSFLRDHPPGRPPRDVLAAHAWGNEWADLLVEHGWAAPAWPVWAGGMDLDLAKQYAYHEEMALARAPRPSMYVGILGPTLMKYGTPTQHERFLDRMLRGRDTWCQGYSEPDAGSDLASLQTRATRDGDDYVVNGQKVWTSGATLANWCFALVRTGPPDSRGKGISYLLVPMDSPGLEVRPLRDISGNEGFAELWFDDVRVPVENRLGDENDGWRMVRTSLGHERSTMFTSQVIRYRRVVDDLLALARERGRAEDPVLRQALADVWMRCRIEGISAERILSRVLQGHEPGPAASVNRLFHARFEQRLHEVAMDVHGAAAMLARTDADAPQGGRWIHGFLKTRASTIGTGTTEIQRNTIADQVLGLPPEPGPTR